MIARNCVYIMLQYLYRATSVPERWPSIPTLRPQLLHLEPVDTVLYSTVAAVCCGSSKRSRCKLMRQSVLGSDNETKAIYGQRMIICQAASNHLGCGVGRATELSLIQQQLQKHRPPRIPATISYLPKSGQEAPSQPDWIRDTNLWEGCTYDLISLQRIRLHCCTARAISLRLQVPH
jgi:hypothetical protein